MRYYKWVRLNTHLPDFPKPLAGGSLFKVLWKPQLGGTAYNSRYRGEKNAAKERYHLKPG